MQLKELVELIAPREVRGAIAGVCTGIAWDERRVSPGMVFVVLPDRANPSPDKAAEAVQRGAIGVIAEAPQGALGWAPQILVPDSRRALAQAAAAFNDHPSLQMKVIGVAGASGGASIPFLAKQLLEACQMKTGLIGTVRHEIGPRVLPGFSGTPEAVEIQQRLAEMRRAGCSACVLEISRELLEPGRLLGVHFDVVIFSDAVETEGMTQSVERNFAQLTGQSTKMASAVIHAGPGRPPAVFPENRQHLTYGLGGQADLRARDIRLRMDGSRFDLALPSTSHVCETDLIGRENIGHVLGALGAAVLLTGKTSVLLNHIRRLRPAPGHLERVPVERPFEVIIDRASSPFEFAGALKTLRELVTGRLLVLFGCCGEREQAKRPRMGALAAEYADVVVITSDNPRNESPAQISRQILEGCGATGAGAVQTVLNRRKAIECILGQARPGDVVLIAGKGHQTYQELENTVIPFDDRLHVEDVMEGLGTLLFGPEEEPEEVQLV